MQNISAIRKQITKQNILFSYTCKFGVGPEFRDSCTNINQILFMLLYIFDINLQSPLLLLQDKKDLVETGNLSKAEK